MQVYRRPKGKWKELAQKHCRGLVETYLGSPVIEWSGHQYMEIEYFGFFSTRGPFPEVNVRGVVVICDGQSVVDDYSTARGIVRLGHLLLGQASRPLIHQMEHFATIEQQILKTKDSIFHEVRWYEKHRVILGRYVSMPALTSLIDVSKRQIAIVRKRAVEASEMLRALNATLQYQPVQADHIEVAEQFYIWVRKSNVENARAILERGELADQLYRELINRQHIEQCDLIESKVCAEAQRMWQTLALAGTRVREELEQTDYVQFGFERIQESLLQEIVDNRLAVYRATLIRSDSALDISGECRLTEVGLDRVVASLPPLPDRPPWHVRGIKQVLSYIGIGFGILMALVGVVLSMLRILDGDVSFPAIAQALFFASWLFILPRYLKRL